MLRCRDLLDEDVTLRCIGIKDCMFVRCSFFSYYIASVISLPPSRCTTPVFPSCHHRYTSTIALHLPDLLHDFLACSVFVLSIVFFAVFVIPVSTYILVICTNFRILRRNDCRF
jgi:hypothetical protein